MSINDTSEGLHHTSMNGLDIAAPVDHDDRPGIVLGKLQEELPHPPMELD
jgi:hypothetical protein